MSYCRLDISLAFAVALLGSQIHAEEPKLGDEISLFNGEDLTGFYTWTEETGLKPAKEFAQVEEGALRISDRKMGYVASKKEYENYHLSFEFRWGKLKRPSKYVRNSGVLLHGHGPDGAAGGRWISSVECQLAQGCEGDIILIRGTNKDGDTIDATLSAYVSPGDDGRPRWDPDDGKLTKYSGRQFWWNNHQAGFEELIDTRGKNDRASPLGEWTKVDVTCARDAIAVKINDHVVNEIVKVSPAKGKICFQGEGYEVFFRKITLREISE